MKLKHLLLFCLLSIFSLACIDEEFSPKKMLNKLSGGRIYSGRKILLACFSQSEHIYYTNSAMGGVQCKLAHGYDQKNLKWVDTLCYKQIQTGPGLNTWKSSPMILLVNLLVAEHPENDYHVLQVGQAGINLYRDCNPAITNGSNSRWLQFKLAMDSATSQVQFDEKVVVWGQGIGDVGDSTNAANYFNNETVLYKTIDSLYNVDTFITYIPYSLAPNFPIVRQAKYDNAAQRNDTYCYDIPDIVSGPTALRTYPAPGEVHPTKYGWKIMADSMFNILK